MLHLRVISPPTRTAAVRDILLREPGATHVTVVPGVAIAPPGDVVEADLARQVTDRLLGELRVLRLHRDGGITLETVDMTLSDGAEAAEDAVPGDPADAVIWDVLVHRTGEESRLSVTYLLLLTLACLLAGVALLTGSPVILVGAMVLSPEFGPLAAMAVGGVLRRGDLLRRGAVALLVGFPVAMAATAAATVVLGLAGLLETATPVSPDQVEFIYQVGPFSLIVALLAGVAGMLSLTSAKSAALVGVFISVTTVPAAGLTSVALVQGQYWYAAQSLLQLLVNLVGFVIASAAVLLISRRIESRRRPSPISHEGAADRR
jgi:uncharacterized hydrophobic protein (TIGR00271 family)